jgi:hypothetical protein|tara:strand:+ start:384 stop:1412 length:1029 start_codon:yes stop_codon:yes gene_type:complete
MAKFSKTGFESGASDLPAITPVNGEFLLPFGTTPNAVLARHRAALDGVDLFPSSRIMEAGNRFEPAIRGWFEDDFYIMVEEAIEGYPSKNTNLVASLDGIIDAKDGWSITDHAGVVHELKSKGVIDFKCPTYKPANPEGMGYHLQLQGQMECTGFEWAILAQLNRVSCDWTISVFNRHQGMIDAITDAVCIFWEHMEEDTDYPPLTTTEANKTVAGNKRPGVHDLTTKTIDDDCPLDANDRDQLMHLADDYHQAKIVEKNGKASKEAAQLAICNIMAGVEKIELPDHEINWTTREAKARPAMVSIELGELTPDLVAKAAKVTDVKPASSSRRFTLTEKKHDK